MFVTTDAPANGRATQDVKLQPSGSLDVARRARIGDDGALTLISAVISGGERIEGSVACWPRNDAHSRHAAAGEFLVGQERVTGDGWAAV